MQKLSLSLAAIFGTALVMIPQATWAGESQRCGVVHVVDAAVACEKLQVQFDLSECGGSPKALASVKCDGKLAEARVQEAEKKFWVKLRALEGAWGAGQWQAQGKPKWEAKRKTVAAQDQKIDRSQRVPASPPASDEKRDAPEPLVKLSGFVDAQALAFSQPGMTRGFLVNDGAIYLTKDISGLDFKIDLPFRLVPDPGVHTPNFEFGLLKAQAFVGQKYSNGLRWKMGQFDTTFGFEVNDTVDVAFTRQGNIYNFTDPFVHLGFLGGFDFSDTLGVNVYFSSPNDSGHLQGLNPQWGGQVVYTGAFRLALGSLITKEVSTGKFNVYGDVVAGLTLGPVAVDAEANYQIRNDLVHPDTGNALKGFGGLVQVLVNASERLSLGTRLEYLQSFGRKDPRATATYLATEPLLQGQLLWFIGPQFQLMKDLKLKVDYSLQRDQGFSGASPEYLHGFASSAVFRF